MLFFAGARVVRFWGGRGLPVVGFFAAFFAVARVFVVCAARPFAIAAGLPFVVLLGGAGGAYGVDAATAAAPNTATTALLPVS